MEPSLAPDRLLICRALGTRARRGSIVVFRHPRQPGMWLVKRVVGLPGEEVEIDLGEVLVDGDRGVDLWGYGQSTMPEGKWVIAEGEVLVLSDNRLATVDDGRSFGPVPMRDMFRLIWPRIRSRQRSDQPGLQ